MKTNHNYKILYNGGPGSGNFGHSGRPGKIGGSTSYSSKTLEKINNVIKNIEELKKKYPNNFLEVLRSRINERLQNDIELRKQWEQYRLNRKQRTNISFGDDNIKQKLDKSILTGFQNTFKETISKYKPIQKQIKNIEIMGQEEMEILKGSGGYYNRRTQTIKINPYVYLFKKEEIENWRKKSYEKDIKHNGKPPFNVYFEGWTVEDEYKHTINHELGHVLQNTIISKIETNDKAKQIIENTKKLFEKYKKNNISRYANTNFKEFFAEWFAVYNSRFSEIVPEDIINNIKEYL